MAAEADLLVSAGNPRAALDVLRGGCDGGRGDPALVLATARAHLACGDSRAAGAVLAPLLRADPDGGTAGVVGACVLDAVCAGRAGDDARAVASLARALALAVDEGLSRPFLDAGAEVTALIDAHPSLRAAYPGFTQVLFNLDLAPGRTESRPAVPFAPAGQPYPRSAATAVGAGAPAWPAPPVAVPTLQGAVPGRAIAASPSPISGVTAGGVEQAGELEHLSDRERAVLSYLPTMLTTSEIASEMYLSVNTVKTHLKSIYRKLDVTRRRDAVRRARELRLL
jgi:LuxR family maltose regulon positive regulatory protein